MNIAKDLIDVIQKYSPTIANVVSSVNPIAGIVFDLVGHLFNVSNGSSSDIAVAINKDPDAAIKLKEFELKHSELFQQYSLQTYQAEVDDKKSAREMNLGNTWIVHFLAIAYMLGFFMYVISSYFPNSGFDKGMFHDLLNVGMLIFSYYFGSSYKK